MRMMFLIPAAMSLAAAMHSPSFADCPETTSSVRNEQRTGIAKDGTHAPMEGSAGQLKTESSTGTTTTSNDAPPKAASKDGNDMPLEESSSIATSEQDVAAQQHGEKTAAQEACN